MGDRVLTRIDANTFHPQLLRLSETMALKVDREGQKRMAVPRHVVDDLFMLLRYAQQAYAFVSYMNADDRRSDDIYWKEQYSILGLIAIRTLIDCLYNVATILENPTINGRRYRCSGLKKFLLNLEEDKARYSERPEWNADFTKRYKLAEAIAKETSVSLEEAKDMPTWKTLGSYLRDCYGRDNELQAFLRKLTLGAWSDYSALGHASFEALIPHGIYFVRDILPQERRPHLSSEFLPFITMHICRAAGVLMCLLTEVQGACRFDEGGTAQIDKRICDVWAALSSSYEVKDFLSARYERFMRDRGIKVGS